MGGLCQFPWFGGWLLTVNAITKWLHSYNESVVFGEIANAPRHTSVMQRRRSAPTNTLFHSMQRLSSVHFLGGPNQLHFLNLTPSVPVLRVFVRSHPKPFLDLLQNPIHLEGLISGVRESPGTCSDEGNIPTWFSSSLLRRQDSQFCHMEVEDVGPGAGGTERVLARTSTNSAVLFARVASKEGLDKSCICAS